MGRRKARFWLLSCFRWFITALPLVLFACNFLFVAFNHTEDAMSVLGATFSWDYVADSFQTFVDSFVAFSGAIGSVYEGIETFVVDILGYSGAYSSLVNGLCAWFVFAQLVYFVIFVFDWVIEFVCGFMSRFSEVVR